jgi:hypothetical protein
LYCGSHSGNLKSSFIIVSPLASGQAPLVDKLKQGIPMVGLYLVAQEPSPREGTAEVCSETQGVYTCGWRTAGFPDVRAMNGEAGADHEQSGKRPWRSALDARD